MTDDDPTRRGPPDCAPTGRPTPDRDSTRRALPDGGDTGAGDGDPGGPGDADPEDAFALVGNEIRAAIVRALGDARGTEGPPPELSFSELRSRTDRDVASSQFNYHLQQLVGHYVEATDGGYRLRPEGTTLYRTLQAGTFDRRSSIGPVETDLDCHFCGTTVEATYEEGLFEVACPGCEYRYDASTRIPAGAIGEGPTGDDVDGDGGEWSGDAGALLSRIDRYNRHKRAAFASGVCPTCAADVATSFVAPEDAPDTFETDRREAYVHHACGRCGNQEYLSVGEQFLRDPGLVAFCHDHGVDVGATPVWHLAFAATDRGVTVGSRDPWRVALEIDMDGDTFTLDIGPDVTVEDRIRS